MSSCSRAMECHHGERECDEPAVALSRGGAGGAHASIPVGGRCDATGSCTNGGTPDVTPRRSSPRLHATADMSRHAQHDPTLPQVSALGRSLQPGACTADGNVMGSVPAVTNPRRSSPRLQAEAACCVPPPAQPDVVSPRRSPRLGAPGVTAVPGASVADFAHRQRAVRMPAPAVDRHTCKKRERIPPAPVRALRDASRWHRQPLAREQGWVVWYKESKLVWRVRYVIKRSYLMEQVMRAKGQGDGGG